MAKLKIYNLNPLYADMKITQSLRLKIRNLEYVRAMAEEQEIPLSQVVNNIIEERKLQNGSKKENGKKVTGKKRIKKVKA